MPLTDEQKSSLWQDDDSPISEELVVVSARPGTGKTTTITEYCIDIAEGWSAHHLPWQGMAVLSYTNVARRELEQKLHNRGAAYTLLGAPHLVGTIDSFVNQYIFLPFGAGLMGYAEGRPKLVGEPYGQWRVSADLSNNLPKNASSPLYFDCYSFDGNDSPVIVDKTPRTPLGSKYPKPAAVPKTTNISKITYMKRYVWAQGFATQSDANYFAHKALKESPTLARSLTRRFPVLVIDEAQDMTEMQHALLDRLIEAGQNHIVMVGDEYQAIYEWNTARPKLFTGRKVVPWRVRTLSKTFRCSPAVCSALTKMADDGKPIEVADDGKNRGYGDLVQLRWYDPNDEQNGFLSALDELAKDLSGRPPHGSSVSDEVKTVAVLARSGNTALNLQSYFTGQPMSPAKAPVWQSRLTKDYLRVVHALSRRNICAAVAAYETLLFNLSGYQTKSDMRTMLAEQWGSDQPSAILYRTVVMSDLQMIKAQLEKQTANTISACEPLCDVTLRAVDASSLSAIKRDCASFANDAKRDQDRLLASLFMSKDDRQFFSHPLSSDVRVIFSTVHGVKGETFDGVIFYPAEKSNGCGCPSKSSNLWAKIMKHDLAECENKRIAYVALSRASQALYIVAPKTSISTWEAIL